MGSGILKKNSGSKICQERGDFQIMNEENKKPECATLLAENCLLLLL